MSLNERIEKCTDKTVKKLFDIMLAKESNLCVAVDVTKSGDLLKLANQLGPYVCCLKTHVDILDDWNSSVQDELKSLASKHSFLLFEDRKFADIGQTVKHQFNHGLFDISKWADLVTVHGLPGPGLLDALESQTCKALIVAEMSSKGILNGDLLKILIC